MKKLAAAVAVVLVFAFAASAALASHQAVTVKATGENYMISGKAPKVAQGHYSTVKILDTGGHVVAREMRYQAPTAADHYAFWVLTKQVELPSGTYDVEITKVVHSKRTNLKFSFTIS